MGEISEALRRARDGYRAGRAVTPSAPVADDLRGAAAGDSSVVIPALESVADRARLVLTRPSTPMAESYRQAALQLSRALQARSVRSVLVASAGVGEGKTTTACNVALAFASLFGTRRSVLVELDLRRPTAAAALGVTPPIGIEHVLAGSASVAAARCATQLPSLDLLLAKKASSDALPLLSGPRLGLLLKELERSYDTVILDSPPILPVPDAALIAANVGGVLLVARAGFSRCAAVEEAVEKIGRDAVMGFFLNDRRQPLHHYYAGYYRYESSAESGEAEGDGARG
jgi:capsular exopolysaccharide synthesis family protein